MSKNLTRKGLAFGALVALASTVIAGTPASAAGELNVVPSAGTSYNALSGTVFNLKTTFAPGFTPSAYAQLKYLVKTDANSVIKYETGLAAVNTAAINNATSPAVVDSVAVSTTSAAISAGATGATDVAYLGLEASTTSVTSSVEVTAFVDANNDGALTAGEWNTVRTVGFKKAADIVPTVSLTAPNTGDTSVKATVSWGDLNVEQISDEAVKFTVGTQFTASAGTLADGVWSKSATGLAAAEAVSAQAYIGSTALGTAVSGTASARTISDTVGLVSNVLKSDDAVATAATTMVTNTAATVRPNGTFTAQVKAFDRATTPAAKAGVAVVGTVALGAGITLVPASTGVTEVSVTVAGTKYTSNATLTAAKIALTTDASGLASVVVSSSGVTAGSTATITVTFAAENLTSAVVATQTAAAYTVVSTGVGSAVRSIAEGGSTTFNFAVKDQFGVAIGSGARLEAVVGYSTSATSYVAVSGGVASVTVTDTTASTAPAITVDTTLQTQSATTSNWAAASTPIVSAQQTVNVHSAAAAFDTDPAAQSIALSTSVALTTSSVNNPGAAVTVAAKGFTFTVGGVDYVDTVTLFSAATSGDVVVSAKSNTSGAQTVTWTVGSVSKTAVVTVAAAAATAGKTITITAPATATPGSTFTVTGKIVDAYGNPVASAAPATFSVTYVGPGFVVGSTLPTATNASGEFSFQVLTGTADAGSGTVTVKYDADGATTTIAELTKTATVLVAAPEAAATIAAATAKINFTIDNAKGELVIIKVANKTVKRFVAYSNAHAFGLKATKGSKAVKVYVAGDLVAAKTVAVK
jgi:hypothetical protein